MDHVLYSATSLKGKKAHRIPKIWTLHCLTNVIWLSKEMVLHILIKFLGRAFKV